ncbi:MAG: 30S ribosomal protein S8 [Firmicutes bacterium]|jgi:small subunit ribosomal protein S8|nr:30S ribosomal protein S8 [Bacillota bacterium]MBQ3286785.1 30S ribosomal protein S8 [Bacillota bacterium]MBQ6536137.1 30S ribosomal protein S8 [Bacillota bacterium]MBQ6606537.1 30S ribosomal protein S8 [Bacillota bacterium]MBR0179080.1 30S ribosomal protein S8 [Bacillota bacterium]
MVVTDPIADFLTRIRNANMVYMDKVEIPASKTKLALANILKDEGFIKDVEYIEDGKQGVIRVYLKYADKKRVISGLKRISRPGLRVYAKKDELPKVLGGLGIAVVSTSSGLMTDKNARKQGLGGEVLCYVW